MTTFLEKIKEKLAEVKKAAHDAAQQVAHVFVPDEVKESRMAICESCEFLYGPTKQCKKCGCFIFTKSSIASSECPIRKWTAVVYEIKEEPQHTPQ